MWQRLEESPGEGKSLSSSELDLKVIAAEVVVCPKCPLSQTRLKAVPGEGPPTAPVLFIGEAPGFHEDRQGQPFVGPAGQFLRELLEVAGLKRADVFITNIVKCRPPSNRDPLPNEIAACSEYLTRQIASINPRVIVTLGRHSMSRFLPGVTISKIHGVPHVVNGLTIFPMYHPAAALHQRALRQTLLDDMQKLPSILAELATNGTSRADSPEIASEKQPVEESASAPRQLDLF